MLPASLLGYGPPALRGTHHPSDRSHSEEIGLEEDLTVGDRNHVGRNVGRYVTRLSFDDWQSGQRTLAVETSGALEQAAVQVENVSRISLTTGRNLIKFKFQKFSTIFLPKPSIFKASFETKCLIFSIAIFSHS